jgi:hypothetical protein
MRVGSNGQHHKIFISGFFIKQLLLVPIGMPRNNFEFLKNSSELFVFVNDFPAKYTRESMRIS